MSDAPVIAVGGENLIDHVTNGDVVSALPGGSLFNVALAVARQEAETHYLSPISTDEWGDMLAGVLEADGVILAGGRSEKPSSIARVTITDGIPSYVFERDDTAERDVTVDGLIWALPEGVQALHTGSMALVGEPDGGSWEALCAEVYRKGLVVSLDPNVRASVVHDWEAYRARVMRVLAHTHILKFSDEDLEALFPGVSQEEGIAAIRAATSASLVVMTLGPAGVRAWTSDVSVSVPAPVVPELVDTVGAGDTFSANLLVGLGVRGKLSPAGLITLSEVDLVALMRRAGTAAALNCAQSGCNPPTRIELEMALV